MDQRLQQLNNWLQESGYSNYHIAPASADASFRRYFRVQHQGQSFIVMDAPPRQEPTAPFIQVAELLADAGLNVPRILARDTEQGFLQLTDLGNRMYLAELDDDTADKYYGDAMAALLRLQQHPGSQLPSYDKTLLMSEMQLFPDWYLRQHLDIALSCKQQQMLQESFELLAESALAQPRVIVHRDYHSRNLMLTEPNPGVLDFQDAVFGPVTYDLVSLLRDCYIAWPRTRVEQWLQHYYQQARNAGIIDKDVSMTQFKRWFDWMGVQRHLKATGIFARLNYRDGKPGYLADIPRTMQYVFDVAAVYPELSGFHALLQELALAQRVSETTPREVTA